MAGLKDIDTETDYYELLGVKIDASVKEITKAYRIKALTLHPDKNPSPDAGKEDSETYLVVTLLTMPAKAAQFQKLSQGYEMLKDTQARAAYDQLLRTRLDRKKKQQEMDSKRRRAQEELEEREQLAKKLKMDQMQAEAQYKAELARLRAEGAKRREEWREAEQKQKEEESEF